MKVITYQKVKDFLQENENILLEKEAVSQLLLFNAMSQQTSETSDSMMFGKVVDSNNNTLLLFCNCLPHNLLIHKQSETCSREAVIALADYIIKKNIIINGVNANRNICDIFIEHYKELDEVEFSEYLAMDIMELKTLTDIELTKGISRKAAKSDCDMIARWIVEFAKDALGEEIPYEDQISKAERMINTDILYLFENSEGKVVSMAASSRQLVHGVSINYVYTPMNYRGLGYAAANMYAMSKDLLSKGNRFCSLFVDKNNPVSNHVYEKVGYYIVEDQYDYRLKK